MAGAYCKFCNHRCFVYRQVLVGGEQVWAGHMATCHAGREHDKRSLGVDFDGAHNPNSPDCPHCRTAAGMPDA